MKRHAIILTKITRPLRLHHKSEKYAVSIQKSVHLTQNYGGGQTEEFSR